MLYTHKMIVVSDSLSYGDLSLCFGPLWDLIAMTPSWWEHTGEAVLSWVFLRAEIQSCNDDTFDVEKCQKQQHARHQFLSPLS